MSGYDMHVHSTISDGTITPEELVDIAVEEGLNGFAITDHDSVGAFPRAINYGKTKNIRVIPGIELSTFYNKKSVHVLGYFFDYTNKDLLDLIAELRVHRNERTKKMLEILDENGYHIEFEELEKHFESQSITSPHIAQLMVDKGMTEDYMETFMEWFIKDKPCGSVPDWEVSPLRALDVIHKAGGVCVLAHPGIIDCDEVIEPMVKAGLDGIEACHSMHTYYQSAKYQALALSYGLFPTAGSDCHYSGLGVCKINQRRLDEIEEISKKYK